MILITLASSLIVIIQLLSFQSKPHKRPKRSYGLVACAICALMMFQITHISETNILHLIFTTILAACSVYYDGNVAHLVRGFHKCIRSVF